MIIPESKLDIWGISIASTKWIWNCLPGCSWCMYIRSRNWIFFPQTFLLIALNLFAETKSGRVAVLMNWLKFMRVHLDRYTSHLPVETSRVQFEQITFTHLRGEALWQSWIQTSLKILLSLKEKKEKKKILYTYAEHRHDSKNTRHVRAHNIFMSFDDQLLFFKTKRTAVWDKSRKETHAPFKYLVLFSCYAYTIKLLPSVLWY